VPDGPFIHFDADTNNIVGGDGMGDPVADALSCIGPQGIDGCGMEATLETMLQALDPNKAWNTGGEPFLRVGAVLAVVIVTDEEDCAVKNYEYFDPAKANDPNYNQYWEDFPGTPGMKKDPTSAVCWNAGTDCTTPTLDTIYESCVSADKGVLQPTSRYINYLKKVLIKDKKKEVVMLGILGVPPVTQRNTGGAVRAARRRRLRPRLPRLDRHRHPPRRPQVVPPEAVRVRHRAGLLQRRHRPGGPAGPRQGGLREPQHPRRPRHRQGRGRAALLHRVDLRHRLLERDQLPRRHP
jgi:hypothetical protein